LLRQDFVSFAARCFQDLNPQAELAMNWHLEVIAAKLTAVREGKIRRLIINLPPRHLKSLMASIAFLRRGRRLALHLGSLTLRRRGPDWNATKRRGDSERRASLPPSN
jgi:hypothetical protein